MGEGKAFVLWVISLVATFWGTCSAIGALTPARPLPWEAFSAALCATIVVGIFGAQILDPTKR